MGLVNNQHHPSIAPYFCLKAVASLLPDTFTALLVLWTCNRGASIPSQTVFTLQHKLRWKTNCLKKQSSLFKKRFLGRGTQFFSIYLYKGWNDSFLWQLTSGMWLRWRCPIRHSLISAAKSRTATWGDGRHGRHGDRKSYFKKLFEVCEFLLPEDLQIFLQSLRWFSMSSAD